jgi:hypothetical protein
MLDEPAMDSPLPDKAPKIYTVTPPEGNRTPADDAEPRTVSAPDEPPPATATTNDDENSADKSEPSDSPAEQGKNRLHLLLKGSQAAILNAMSGHHNRAESTTYNYLLNAAIDGQQSLDVFTRIDELQSSPCSYTCLDSSTINAHSGILLTQRILLLSCHNEDIVLNVAKAVAFETKVFTKKLVTLDKNGPGNFNFWNLVDLLAGPKKKRPAPGLSPHTICVWAVNETTDDDISSTILTSLLAGTARIQQYQARLTESGLCIICLVSPRRMQEYKDSRLTTSVQNWEIDFLIPLLEAHGLSEYEKLAETINHQRRERLWSENGADFYKEIARHLGAGTLPKIVAERPLARPCDDLGVEQLFNREDPLIDAVLYSATFFPNLSTQDFAHLVELYLGDETEDIVRPDRQQLPDGQEAVRVVESVPLVRRWRCETDRILRRCKLAAVETESGRRVVDFQVDGLRNRLRHHIRNEHYFLYESSFNLLRHRGVLFSPRKGIADGARQLLVEMASQCGPDEVANWLYEVVREFEELAETSELLREQSGLFQLLPDAGIKVARRYVSHGLGLVINRLNKEPRLQEALDLFWQKLIRLQPRWFLELLRRMGSFPPPESLSWLKQLLDQGTKEIRRQALDYLVRYLLYKDPPIYATLKEIMQWPSHTQAGQTAQELLVTYCFATNKQLAQTEYGQWPSLHPLFVFPARDEAADCLDLLIGWLYSSTYAIDPDSARFDIAEILAAWYFILSSPSDSSSEIDAPEVFNAQRVRNMLLASLAKHCSRARKNSLLAIWEDKKAEILEEVFQLEAHVNQLIGPSLNSQLLSDLATVRRKLMEARTLLSELRKDFIRSTEEITAA